MPYCQWWANIYLHTFDSDLRFLLYRSPTLFTLFFKGRIEGQRLLPSIFCKVGVDGSMFFNLDSVKVDSYPSWSTKIDVEGSIFEKKWRPLPFTLIFSFPQNLVCECWRQTSTPTDPHPPLPLPIHNECLTSWWGGGGREGVSLGWSHKVRGKKWAYRTWGVGQWLRGNRRYRTLYICIQFITILQKPLHPPPPANCRSTPLAISLGA